MQDKFTERIKSLFQEEREELPDSDLLLNKIFESVNQTKRSNTIITWVVLVLVASFAITGIVLYNNMPVTDIAHMAQQPASHNGSEKMIYQVSMPVFEISDAGTEHVTITTRHPQKTSEGTDSVSTQNIKLNSMPDGDRNRMFAYISRTGGVKNMEILNVLNDMDMDSTLVVLDCTGSMESARNQVLLWLAGHTNSSTCFALFNDDRQNRSGIAGAAGGVYTGRYKSYYDLILSYEMMEQTMGKNREPSENNIEAILVGLEEFTGVNKVLLIADGESSVRDLHLLSRVKKPVYVIADEHDEYPIPDYLEIAALTNGYYYIGNGNWATASIIKNGGRIHLGKFEFEFNTETQHVEYILPKKRGK